MKTHITGTVTKQDLFVSGRDGYHTYRIPSIITTSAGTLLAFCEARRLSRSDSGDIDIVMRRSTDGGRSWSPMQVIADAGDEVFGNPCPVVDRDTGTIWMPLNWNLAEGGEGKIVRGEAKRDVYMMKSDDDGASWTTPENITDSVKPDDWTWYATGPGHGIQLATGRLLIPCDFGCGEPDPEHEYFGSHVIVSDDHGATWRAAGSIQGKLNECQAVELTDGRVCLNMRSYFGKNRRAIAFSSDGGDTWTEPRLDDALIEPICQAGLHAIGDGRVVFSNPASTDRARLTVKVSDDDCETWDELVVLHEGPAAYSDLAWKNGKVFCLYECGEESAYDRITLAEISVS